MLPRLPSRRTALTAALVAPLLAVSLAGCGGSDGASTAAVATSASTTTPAPTGGTTPSVSVAPSPGAVGELLPERAQALGAAFSAGDFGAIWDLACPGVRKDASRDDYITTMTAAPEVVLANPTILDDKITDETRAELADPGVTVDSEALVRYDVAPGSASPNPTMTAWFVGTSSGWLYCGMVPDA